MRGSGRSHLEGSVESPGGRGMANLCGYQGKSVLAGEALLAYGVSGLRAAF